MSASVKNAMSMSLVFWVILSAVAACQFLPDASVNGTVTYRERLTLTPGATLTVELRDVSYADGPAPLIASQTISDPRQVPIEFVVKYSRDDIKSRNTYALQARIVESDGRLAFTNDTAYDVITGGNPDSVDMLMVLVEPPPNLLEGVDAAGADWRTWVERPASVTWANRIPNESDHFLRIGYFQSTIEGCARPGSQELELDGYDIIARVTLMMPPPTPWAIPCDEQMVELDTVQLIEEHLEPGRTYRVIVNDRETTTFTLPGPELRDTFLAESPIESWELETISGTPHQYRLRVVSSIPGGSRCSQFNGFEIRRREPNRVEVSVTHHETVDPFVTCTEDHPVVETSVPLGSDFEPGRTYTVSVNSGEARSFVAR